MAWTKGSTTTKAWTLATAEDVLDINGYAVDGTSVLQEYIAFLVTRGWVGSLTPTVNVQASYTDYEYYIQKTAVCEDGASGTWGFKLMYRWYDGASDELKMYMWEPATDTTASTLLMDVTISTSDLFGGKWSFWVSGEDSDSFAVIPGSGSTVRCIGFWPHSGDLFNQGYYNANWVKVSGLKPLFNNYNSFEGVANNGDQPTMVNYGGDGFSGSGGMNPQSYKLDYMWLLNGYDRPLFRSFGSDIHTYINPTASGPTIFGLMSNTAVDSMKIGSNYYIAIGEYNKMLLDCGSVPPIF